MAADWNKIRKEYIKGGVSYRQLAAKYGVALRNIARRASDENWVQLRQQAYNKATSKTVSAVAEQGARVDTKVYDTAVMLLDALQFSIDAITKDESGNRLPLYPKATKDYSDALKALQSVIDSKPTELDLEEQKARIAKLQKDAAPEESRHKTITVNLGGMEQYAK